MDRPKPKEKKPWKGVPTNELWDCGVASLQGTRPTMEDAHVVKLSVHGEFTPALLAGICDGHGGASCSKFLVEEIPKSFFHELTKASPLEAFQNSFALVDNNWLKLAKEENLEDGSTALFLYLVENQMWIAHTGDCRALVATKGKIAQLTQDHDASDPAETERYLLIFPCSQ